MVNVKESSSIGFLYVKVKPFTEINKDLASFIMRMS